MPSSADEQAPPLPEDSKESKEGDATQQCPNRKVTGQTTGPMLDPLFDFELVVFKVENTLFRVPKLAFLNASEPENPFLKLFSLTPLDPNNVEGASLDNPIILEDESANDFRAFLHALYPLFAHSRTFEENVGVLRLATKWNYDKIRKKAIQDLSVTMADKGAALKTHMGNEFKVPSWLISGLVKVVMSENLDINNLRSTPYHMDWETIAKIFYIQNLIATAQACPKLDTIFMYHMPGSRCDCWAKCHVVDIFNNDIVAATHPNETREQWGYRPTMSRGNKGKKLKK